jgi:hypothetical protein
MDFLNSSGSPTLDVLDHVKCEDATMELPRVSSVGLTELPRGFRARRRRYSRTARVVATVTTVVSLGSYCLTSDGSNTSGLPQSYLRP